MIDLHCHILPAFDDGAATLQDALAMAEVAFKDGIRQIVASPHLGGVMGYERAYHIAEAVALLNQELKQQGISVEVIGGPEVAVSEDIPKRLDEGYPLTVGGAGKYLLLEPPYQNLPLCTGQVVFELLARGVTPIITHPERALEIQRSPDLLATLAERGALGQITGSSVIGALGPRAKATAETMLRHGLAHFIATDAHSWKARPPVLARAVETARRLLGDQAAHVLVEDNPALVLRGERVPSMPVTIKRRQSGWQAIWRRVRGS